MHLLYQDHAFLFWLASLVFLAATAIACIAAHRRIRSLEARLDDVFHGASGDNTARMLADYLGTVRGTAAVASQLQNSYAELSRVLPSAIRHVGLVRFSPFHDTGGDQSFALALLDGRGNGVVVTALHSRSDSRLYAKPIEEGRSSYTLTPEENTAMNRAFGRTESQAS